MNDLYGLDLFGEPIEPQSRGQLFDDFVYPPFSVLNARDGWWQDRKRAWVSMGIQSELGRNVIGKNAWQDLSNNPRRAESTRKIAAIGDGPTIFDPVLCELMYQWFCPVGGQVVDPFAGGSVRGIVAHSLGRLYWGCDLSCPQIEANIIQGNDILDGVRPSWVWGDAIDMVSTAPPADFIFTCPPYGDLEVYSDDKRDLSNMGYYEFMSTMSDIFRRAFERLKDNRFAAIVAGEYRSKAGVYHGFVPDIIKQMQRLGFAYYNEAILITAVGSLPIRTGKQFRAGRKLGKTHQNILIFVKGDWRAASDNMAEAQKRAVPTTPPLYNDKYDDLPLFSNKVGLFFVSNSKNNHV